MLVCLFCIRLMFWVGEMCSCWLRLLKFRLYVLSICVVVCLLFELRLFVIMCLFLRLVMVLMLVFLWMMMCSILG